MKLQIQIQIKPFSLNRTERSMKGGRRYKSDEFKSWANYVQICLRSYADDLKKFNEHCKNRMPLRRTLYWSSPDVLTKKKEISLSGGDIDNQIKPITDEVFKHLPDLDDAQIVKNEDGKFYSSTDALFLTLEPIPDWLDTLPELSDKFSFDRCLTLSDLEENWPE